MLAQHKLTKQRNEVLLKGIAFMHRYLSLRRNALQRSTVLAAATTSISTGVGGTITAVSSSSSSSSSAATAGEIATATATATATASLHYELALYQETLYNLGRAFHDIQLYHLAADQYNAALDLALQYPGISTASNSSERSNTNNDTTSCNTSGSCRSVTREAAHNLVQIYKRSGALDLALEVMQNFLVI